jgi:endonuclease G
MSRSLPIDQLMKPLATLLLLPLAALAADPPFGSPACSGPSLEPAGRDYFFLCHDGARKVPLWVGYALSPAMLGGSAPRPSRFRQDYELAGPAAADRDYRHSGFSRGHLAPARDFAFSDAAIRSTFVLSNAAPLKQALNAGVLSRIEALVRDLAREADQVFVFTGTLFEGEPLVIGAGRVAVPTHIFKALLVLKGESKIMTAFIVPNQDSDLGPIHTYRVSVDEVEKRSGLDFFRDLEDTEESSLESLGRSTYPTVTKGFTSTTHQNPRVGHTSSKFISPLFSPF